MSGMISYRPCLVKGEKKAIFHGYVTDEKMLINFTRKVRSADVNKLIEQILDAGVFPDLTEPVLMKKTYALVEYYDGTVEKVDIEDIQFEDSMDKREEDRRKRKEAMLDVINKQKES